MTNNIGKFRKDFLGANSWEQRKDGVPLDLLDKLSAKELLVAEAELIKSAGPGDTWPILGLGHIKSTQALPILYNLLEKSSEGFKITIAYSIFQICQNQEMIGIVLEELPKTTNEYELIDVLYLLPGFKDEKISGALNKFREHKDYLIAYNSARALGLSTDDIVNKFRKKEE